MISKIIQKEKERQEGHLNDLNGIVKIIEHKQSLINLKEYLEEQFEEFKNRGAYEFETEDCQLKIDITELTKLIEAYNV